MLRKISNAQYIALRLLYLETEMMINQRKNWLRNIKWEFQVQSFPFANRTLFPPNVHLLCMYRGADKSLARPGRKQATVTKLLHATQKKFRRLSVQPGLRGSNDVCVGRKIATFQLFFQSGRAKDLSAPLYYVILGLLILSFHGKSVLMLIVFGRLDCAANLWRNLLSPS